MSLPSGASKLLAIVPNEWTEERKFLLLAHKKLVMCNRVIAGRWAFLCNELHVIEKRYIRLDGKIRPNPSTGTVCEIRLKLRRRKR